MCQTQFLLYPLFIRFDSLGANTEPIADFWSGVPFGNELEHVTLALRQAFELLAFGFDGIFVRDSFCQDTCSRWLHVRIAMRYCSDRRNEFAVRGTLDQVSRCPSFEERYEVFFLFVHGQDKDTRRQLGCSDRLGRSRSIEVWHGQIHDDNVGFQPLDDAYRLAPVRGLAYDLDVGCKTQDRLEASANNRMIVGKDDTNDIIDHNELS
jgi:hypothetical protein